jgi:hypothetical protein
MFTASVCVLGVGMSMSTVNCNDSGIIMGGLCHRSHMTGWAVRWVEKYSGKCWEISK